MKELLNIGQALGRDEMKKLMAGSGGGSGTVYCSCFDNGVKLGTVACNCGTVYTRCCQENGYPSADEHSCGVCHN